MLIHMYKCDFCGKQFDELDEQEKFGIHFPHVGFGSEYDGSNINIDLCCDCFDKMMKEYVEPNLLKESESITEAY